MITPNVHIWLILDSRSFGGIETHILQLAKGLIKYQQNTKIRVKVIFLSDYGEHPLKEKLSNENIPYSIMKRGLYSLFKEVSKKKPALIHSHGYKAGIISRVVGVTKKIPVVSTFHAGEQVKGKVAVYDFIDRFSSVFSQEIIAVSQTIKNKLPKKATVINNFVAINDKHKRTDKQIAFVGRLSFEKGADNIIRLARYFTRQVFHIYGDGPMRAQLELAAGSNVIFHGHQQDMSLLWSKIGLLVLPSRFEGLPMTALEAMSNSIPVLAYNVGALNQLINDKNGWLVKANCFFSLKQSLLHWLTSNPFALDKIKNKARETIIKHYSDDAVIPVLINIYHQAITAKRRLNCNLHGEFCNLQSATCKLPNNKIKPKTKSIKDHSFK